MTPVNPDPTSPKLPSERLQVGQFGAGARIRNRGCEGLNPYAGLINNFEGWVGVDQFDERNKTFMSMLDRSEKRFGRRPVHCYTAQGYDMGNAVAHGLARARPHSRDGLRRGLEKVRRLDAAAGGPGNHISFGPYDHRGYKGDFIVMRQVRDGKNVLAPRPASHGS